MSDESDLRECPFCGSSNVGLWRGQIIGNRPDNGMRFARCLNCGASTSYRDLNDAIRCWNERRDQREDEMADLIEALKEIDARPETYADIIRRVRPILAKHGDGR